MSFSRATAHFQQAKNQARDPAVASLAHGLEELVRELARQLRDIEDAAKAARAAANRR